MGDYLDVYHEDLPTRRRSIRGVAAEGEVVTLVHAASSRKPYRCPRCGAAVELGLEHVIARYSHPARPAGRRHVHMHRACAQEMALELRQLRAVEATGDAALPGRGRHAPGRRG